MLIGLFIFQPALIKKIKKRGKIQFSRTGYFQHHGSVFCLEMPQIQLLLVRTDQNRAKDMTAVNFHRHPLLFFLHALHSSLPKTNSNSCSFVATFCSCCCFVFPKCILLNTGNTKCIFCFKSSVLVLPSKRLVQHCSDHSDLVSLGAPHFPCIHVVHSCTGKCCFFFFLTD